MTTAKDISKKLDNGDVTITKIVRETVDGPHVWGKNAFEYSPFSKGFKRVVNNMMECLCDMRIAEDGVGKRNIELYNSMFEVGESTMTVPNTNNPKWWYVVFFTAK